MPLWVFQNVGIFSVYIWDVFISLCKHNANCHRIVQAFKLDDILLNVNILRYLPLSLKIHTECMQTI